MAPTVKTTIIAITMALGIEEMLQHFLAKPEPTMREIYQALAVEASGNAGGDCLGTTQPSQLQDRLDQRVQWQR